MKLLQTIKEILQRQLLLRQYRAIYSKYREFTMIPESIYLGNLDLCRKYAAPGCIVECGVWRGGMIAGIADMLGDERTYILFDSFEGLPEAQEIDGAAAVAWQKNKEAPLYYENCKADIEFAKRAMELSHAHKVDIVKGWFSDTLRNYPFTSEIAVLRLDGDWYESTFECLNSLYPKVAKGGVIILDDYYFWDGCSRAVHDYLSINKLTDRIEQSEQRIYHIVKR
jgi:O-methyltransferase